MNFKIQSMGHVVLITDQFNSKIGSTPILGTVAWRSVCRQYYRRLTADRQQQRCVGCMAIVQQVGVHGQEGGGVRGLSWAARRTGGSGECALPGDRRQRWRRRLRRTLGGEPRSRTSCRSPQGVPGSFPWPTIPQHYDEFHDIFRRRSLFSQQ